MLWCSNAIFSIETILYVMIIINIMFYVSLYYSKNEFSPDDTIELFTVAEKYNPQSFGTPETSPFSSSPDPGDIAFRFKEIENAFNFAREALGLEDILEVRIGYFDKSIK
jgi:hypothetical protein